MNNKYYPPQHPISERMSLENEVLLRIIPTEEQKRRVAAATRQLVVSVRKEVERMELDLKVILVGSVAKDTYLYKPDIDVFVAFPPNTDRGDLEAIGLYLGKRILGGEQRYAEHPYIHGVWQGFEVDLVPCYDLKKAEDLQSAVDRTPFHTQYIKDHLLEEQRDQVRLLKQFMKGIGVYGAEAKVQGFSGYLVELLILKYGDFCSVMKQAIAWRKGETLFLEGRPTARFSTPLVFFDPVDPKRNVSSALSLASHSRFVFACQEYLHEPRLSFFFPRPRRAWTAKRIEREVKRRGTALIAVRMHRPDLIDDNLYPQIRKTLEGAEALLEAQEFCVVDKAFHLEGQRITLLYELMTECLPKGKKHLGPPVWIPNSTEFLEKWKGKAISGPFIEGDRWVAQVPRKHVQATKMLRKEMRSAAIGADLKPLKGLEILDHDSVLHSDMRTEITELLDKTWPWDR